MSEQADRFLISPNSCGGMRKYRVSAYESDSEGRLKIGTIFDWLQNAMDEYSTSLGVGRDFCKAHNLSYVLRGYDVSISSLPHWTDQVRMQTILSHATPTSFFVQQVLYDYNFKERLLTSCGQVVLVDVKKGKPVRIKDCLPLPSLPFVPFSLACKKIPPMARVDAEYSQQVPFDYIDFNQHVNNSKYVVLAERGLSPTLLKKMQLKHIAVSYKKAVKLGDFVEVETQQDESSSLHQVVSPKDKSVFARVAFAWWSLSQGKDCR